MDTSRYGDDLASKSFSSVWSPKGLCLLHIGEIVKKKKNLMCCLLLLILWIIFTVLLKFFFSDIFVKKESSFIVKLLIFKIGS